MKLLLTTILFTVSSLMFGALLQLKGTYKGENLILRNPVIKDSKSHSITSILLNDQKIETDLNHHTIEIHFETHDLPLNTAIDIKIYYTPNYKPEVVNISAIKAKTLFAFNKAQITESSVIIMTRGEAKESKFLIQRFENSKWVILQEHATKGNRTVNYYDFPVKHYSGTSKFRILYIQKNGYQEYTKEISYTSSKTPINFYPSAKVKDKIVFLNNNKTPVKYAIYNMKGQLVTSGRDTQVDCSKFTVKEVYTIYFDNQKKVFQKAKNK